MVLELIQTCLKSISIELIESLINNTPVWLFKEFEQFGFVWTIYYWFLTVPIEFGMDYFANRCYVPVTAAQSYAGSFFECVHYRTTVVTDLCGVLFAFYSAGTTGHRTGGWIGPHPQTEPYPTRILPNNQTKQAATPKTRHHSSIISHYR